jgi:hypothetical protein
MKSFNTRTGAIILTSSDVISALTYTPANLLSPTFSGVPAAVTAASGTNTTQLATTAFVAAAVATFASGTVTSASVVSANGFGGTVGTATTTPAITLTTSVTGLVKGVGGALVTAIAGTDYATTNALQTFTKAQVGGVVALTSSAATTTINMSLGNNFSQTLNENTTWSNPINALPGTSGQIALTQHATTPYTVNFGTSWLSTDGTTLTVSSTLGAVNLVTYYVADSTHVWFAISKRGVA